MIIDQTERSNASSRRPPHPWAMWPTLSIAGVLTVAHAVMGAFGDYWIDEVYMLAAGRFHPDWGYADQPPLVPMIGAAMDFLAPDSMFVLRLPVALATGATVVLVALLAREFGADRRAQTIAALAGGTGLWANLVGHWLAPYSFEPLLWTALFLPLVRWLRQHSQGVADDRLLLVFGLVLGINLQAKFQVAILCAAMLLSTLVVGPRALLARPKLWAGAGIALVIASPALIWQALHGWPQLEMARVVAAESPILSGGRSGTAVMLLLYSGVLGTALVLIGLWLLLTKTWLRPYRMFALAMIALWIFFVVTAARPYYLIGMYGLPIAAAVVGLQRRRETKPSRWGWAAWPVYAATALAAGGMIFSADAINRGFSTEIIHTHGDRVSDGIARKVSDVYLSLPAEQRSRTAVVGDSYISASMLDIGSRHHPLPEVYSPHRGYGFFGHPDDGVDTIVLFARKADEARPFFTDARLVTDDGDLKVWVLSGRTVPWEQIWPAVTTMQ
ncbi:ArnT family glycosyltransferase [Saccharopolyspora flava]|uniref:Dolichyl-phosphate-mannose-protein mannosyltransferase n=1 Tax=Saccharopolyspora flava TaxID=95161 RepID=A0A1I6QFX4_9PSEU|nr:glycosyltransferase family 39 protein [Saccharopolyspora flava]SFS51344.1 Dolichyl-phosphate-mannose-protein mannosyltransferase [Saccharopolyspora flava]